MTKRQMLYVIILLNIVTIVVWVAVFMAILNS